MWSTHFVFKLWSGPSLAGSGNWVVGEQWPLIQPFSMPPPPLAKSPNPKPCTAGWAGPGCIPLLCRAKPPPGLGPGHAPFSPSWGLAMSPSPPVTAGPCPISPWGWVGGWPCSPPPHPPQGQTMPPFLSVGLGWDLAMPSSPVLQGQATSLSLSMGPGKALFPFRVMLGLACPLPPFT